MLILNLGPSFYFNKERIFRMEDVLDGPQHLRLRNLLSTV